MLSATTQDFHKNLELSNPQEVNQELLEIYELLNLNSISLGNYDVPFLVVDKETKRGRIILGDLEQVSFMEKDEFARESTKNHNLSRLRDFAWLINHKFLVNGELELIPDTV